MAEIQPIGLPNLISQSDLLVRMRSAQAGSDAATQDQLRIALNEAEARRREQVQRVARVEPTGKRQQRQPTRDGDDQHAYYDDEPDEDPGDDGHHLDLSA